jgi:hypothetical protein
LTSEPLSTEAAAAWPAAAAASVGAASARIIVAAFSQRGLLPRSARAIIDEASEAIGYNYEILRNTLDHVGMGIAAFDGMGRLEISNDRFATLLCLNAEAVTVGAVPERFGAELPVVALLKRPRRLRPMKSPRAWPGR